MKSGHEGDRTHKNSNTSDQFFVDSLPQMIVRELDGGIFDSDDDGDGEVVAVSEIGWVFKVVVVVEFGGRSWAIASINLTK